MIKVSGWDVKGKTRESKKLFRKKKAGSAVDTQLKQVHTPSKDINVPGRNLWTVIRVAKIENCERLLEKTV